MSGSSLTVVGGVNSSTITGLVTVPAVIPNSTILNNLQAFLTNTVSGAVTGGGANFQNYVAAGASGNVQGNITVGSGTAGLLEVTNTESTGATVSGPANVNFTVPDGYNYLVVQAPGFETISGNNATNFLATFGSLTGVTFNTGGSGTVAALGSGDYVGLINGTWSALGTGSDSIATSATNATINTFGTSNVVGLLGGSATVNAAGTSDLIETYNSGVNGVVSVTGVNERILVDGGSDTVYAAAGQTGTDAFFNLSGGTMYFVNNSTTSAYVTGGVPNAIGGAVTAFGGAGGGSYNGGPGGNNSLIGGFGPGSTGSGAAGLVSLYGAGTTNFLEATGSVTGSGSNWLVVNSAGSSTLVATATTNNNEFYGGASGTTSMISSGAGKQDFFILGGDTETLTGSTVSGATNTYHFELPSTGGGTVYITNFTLGSSNVFNVDDLLNQGQVSIAGAVTIPSGGSSPATTLITLSDGAQIFLVKTALTTSQIASITGSTSFT